MKLTLVCTRVSLAVSVALAIGLGIPLGLKDNDYSSLKENAVCSILYENYTNSHSRQLQVEPARTIPYEPTRTIHIPAGCNSYSVGWTTESNLKFWKNFPFTCSSRSQYYCNGFYSVSASSVQSIKGIPNTMHNGVMYTHCKWQQSENDTYIW